MKLKRAYQAGRAAALEKFAFAVPQLSPDARHNIELAGLGLIAAPVAHSLYSLFAHGDEQESPTLSKIKHTSDLSGLALLAAPTILDKLRGH